MRKREFEDAVRYGSELERERLRQLQMDGIEAAKERGVRFGRPKVERPETFKAVTERFQSGFLNRKEAADELGVSVSTFDRWRKGVH